MTPKTSSRAASGGPRANDAHSLNVYSAAAIAAGVSVLALAPAAEAHIVMTKKTIQIQPNHLFSIDLNHDGVTDLQFYLRSNPFDCAGGDTLYMNLPVGNAVVGGSLFRSSSIWASALQRGAVIGPAAHFGGKGNYARIESSVWNYCSGSSHTQESGNWGGVQQNRYVGVKFLIHGATHYGWIRLSTDFPAKLGVPAKATITAYAYETVANKPINAGSSSDSALEDDADRDALPASPSLGMLAVGAEALPLWRKEEVTTSH